MWLYIKVDTKLKGIFYHSTVQIKLKYNSELSTSVYLLLIPTLKQAIPFQEKKVITLQTTKNEL